MAMREEPIMQFGAFLPTHWSDYGTTPIHVAIEDAAKAAEALGYHGGWSIDVVSREDYQVIEPFVTLASLVHLVPRLTLGIAVLVLPYRNAILVAKQAAALDILSQHRLILGVGIGHMAREFALVGADYASRSPITDEQIEVVQALWREPSASYAGKLHRFDGVSIAPRPPEGGPPIWIGGNTQGAIRRAARYGVGWVPYAMDLDAFRSGVMNLRDLTHDRRCPTIANVFPLRIKKPDEPVSVRSTTPWVKGTFAGGTDAIVGHLDAYRQAGLEYALVVFESEDLDDLLRQMRLFAEDVMPQFSDAG
jgi:probable F420-dependent oxidoreductase